MLSVMRKVRLYQRITKLIDNYISKYQDAVHEFDHTSFNTLYMTILGLADQSRYILFRKVLIDLLARDNNILLDGKARRFIRENFTPVEQETIFRSQWRDISLLKYFYLGDFHLFIEELITLFFYTAPPIYFKLWREYFSDSILKENLSLIADQHGELIHSTTQRLFTRYFPSITISD